MTTRTDPEARLYEVSIEVDLAGHALPRFAQATVTAAAWGASSHEAIAAVSADLAISDYRVLSGGERAVELSVTDWDTYIKSRWPARLGDVPTGAELELCGTDRKIVQLGFYPHE